MSYNKTLFGNTVSVPEAGNANVGPATTAILDDLIDGVDQSFTLVGSNVIPKQKSTTSVLAGGATLTQTEVTHRVSGSGGAVTLSGTTAIADGSVNGQILVLVGDHATNTVTIQNGANVQLRGDVTLNQHEAITLEWNSTQGDWTEKNRSGSHRFRNQNALEFYELAANGFNKISLRAPAALAADLTYTWPGTIVDGGFLQVAADGSTTWGTASAQSLDSAYNGGSTITVDTAAITATVTAAINGIRIAKTNAGAGSPLSIENDGTGAGIDVQQDGAALAVEANRTLGGQVARFRTTGAGVSSSITVECDTQTRVAVLGTITSGNMYVGTQTNHSFDIYTNNTARATFDTVGAMTHLGSNGSTLSRSVATVQTGALSGGTVDVSGLIPAGARVEGVTARVTTAITGATSFEIGYAGGSPDLNRFGTAIGIGLGTTSNSFVNGDGVPTTVFASATDIRLTANGANFTGGVVRITCWYQTMQAPTS